jgi:alpha-L-fucosidase
MNYIRLAISIFIVSVLITPGWAQSSLPAYLQSFKAEYHVNPRKANLDWFKQAKFGLFMHYGLYSILEDGEWIQLRHDPPIPVAEYAKLKDQFTAENFDADFITDLVLEAGMKYITITARHHDSFCLFNTKQTDFNSLEAPCGRDLIGELYTACEKKGIALFLYYSYALDWKHPYFYPADGKGLGWKPARPAYTEPQPEYKFKKDSDFKKYIQFTHKQLKELLTQYPNIAGIWLDPIMGYYNRPELFPIEKTYKLIRSLSPHALISFKQGANGDEDFVAPERQAHGHRQGGELAKEVWEKNKDKPKEICTTLQPRVWGYRKSVDGKHFKVDDVMKMLADAKAIKANLLLNVGPLPDGSFPSEDIETLKKVGLKVKNKM